MLVYVPSKVFYVWMIELWLLFRQKITQGIVWMYSYRWMTRFSPLLLISCLQLVNASHEKALHSTFWSARSPKEWLWFEWLHMVCVRNDDVCEMNLNNGIEREKLLIIRLSVWRRSNSMITGYTRKRMRREKNKFPARYAQIKSQMRFEIREVDMRSRNVMAAQSFEPL